MATLADLVRADVPATVAPCLTPIGTGKHNASYRVDDAPGRYVLRLAPPDDAGFLIYERWKMR